MNKVRKIKIDLFRSDKHKELFELMKPNLNDKEQHEAVSRLMFMTSQEVLSVMSKLRGLNGPLYF
tara:strand:- start:287 stop:481 length:195 start_codon:yes stop_codon:yes gene_type:complete